MTPEPSPEQRRAIDSDAHALEIRAGPGTGKTWTLARRVARFATDPASARRIVVVTFTREATATLQRRLSLLLGRDHAVRVGSFHQWAARELPHDERAFLGEAAGRAIVDLALRSCPGLRGAFADEAASRALSAISFVKSAETSLHDALRGPLGQLAPWEDELAFAIELYETRKGDRLDYDDLLLRFRDRIATSAGRRAALERLDHLFVDEYQDVSRVQADVVGLLTTGQGGARATVVGDARQSIYAFRGGSPEHLERFLEPYGRRGQRVALTRSFRATRPLVAAANAALPSDHDLRARPKAPAGARPEVLGLSDAAEEADLVVSRASALVAAGVDEAEVAVLARTRALLSPANWALTDAGLDRVRCATIHAAKGQEWDHVLLVGAREGGLPCEAALRAPAGFAKEALEEERRLFYVALTRARLSFTATWAPQGRRQEASRFLAAIAPGCLDVPGGPGGRASPPGRGVPRGAKHPLARSGAPGRSAGRA